MFQNFPQCRGNSLNRRHWSNLLREPRYRARCSTICVLHSSMFFYSFSFGVLRVSMISLKMLALSQWVEKPYYRRKTPLVIGGTRIQVLANSMANAACVLSHCDTLTFIHIIRYLKNYLMSIHVYVQQTSFLKFSAIGST